MPVVTKEAKFHDEFTIGSAKVPKDRVDNACAKIFAQLELFCNELRKEFDIRPQYWKMLNITPFSKCSTFDPMPKQAFSSLDIPKKLLYQGSEETRYCVRLFYDISKLDVSEPIGALVVPISKRIAKLGFPCKVVEIRIEKGCSAQVSSLGIMMEFSLQLQLSQVLAIKQIGAQGL